MWRQVYTDDTLPMVDLLGLHMANECFWHTLDSREFSYTNWSLAEVVK